MYSILVVEDEENILKLMKIRLNKSGFNVYTATNGKIALDMLTRIKPDIAIVDIMMPVMDGFELVENMRKNGNNIPIIMATAKESLEDKSRCFALGVDDYIVKPFAHDELVMRINAILKRTKTIESKNLVIGDTTLDYDNLCISNKKESVNLTKKEFDLLNKLLSAPGRVFTKGQLLDACWGYNSDTYEETLKVHVNRVREKIKNFDEIGIETVRGLGYKGVIKNK